MTILSAVGFTLFGMIAGAVILTRIWFAGMANPEKIQKLFVALGNTMRGDRDTARRDRYLKTTCPLCGPTQGCPACGRSVEAPIPVEIETDTVMTIETDTIMTIERRIQ